MRYASCKQYADWLNSDNVVKIYKKLRSSGSLYLLPMQNCEQVALKNLKIDITLHCEIVFKKENWFMQLILFLLSLWSNHTIIYSFIKWESATINKATAHKAF